MTNAHRILISALGAEPLAVPPIRSQDVRPSVARVIDTQRSWSKRPATMYPTSVLDRPIIKYPS